MEYYNNVRLHSAIGYITPKDKLEGREKEIFKERDRKLLEARETRKARRKEAQLVDQSSTVKAAIAPAGLGLDSNDKYLVDQGMKNPPYQ